MHKVNTKLSHWLK